MKIRLIAAALVLFASPALAEQKPDPEFLQKALTVMQAQRNNAMDADAVAEAKLATTTDELAKAQARIKELEAKSGDKAKK